MKTKLKIFAAFAALSILAAGCVDTVTGRKTAAVPFVKDSIEGRYEGRTVEDAFEAAKAVMAANGVLVNESVLHGQSNLVKTVEGRVNQRNVWVRIEQLDPRTISVTVQTRTPGGGPDIDLAAHLREQIALKLVR